MRARALWCNDTLVPRSHKGIPIAAVEYPCLSFRAEEAKEHLRALTAVARPFVEHAASAAAGSSNQVQRPFGPTTPSALWEQREYVLANPPGDYSLSIDRPLEQPLNWLALLILLPVVLSGYAMLNTVLGLAAGAVTSGLSPPARRNARWAIGLFGGIAFFVALAVADSAVQASTETSAFVGVLPLLVPVSELALLVFLIRRRDARLHVPKDADV